jgi:hypothetical protein
MINLAGVAPFMIPIAGIALVGLIVWLTERRKEKEAFYRADLLRKISEASGESAQKVLEMMRHEDRQAQLRRREGLKLGGLIVMAAGLGFMAMLWTIERSEPVWTIGLIPLLIGAVLFGYVILLAPRNE